MTDDRAETILRILRQTYAMPKWTRSTADPFKTLIATILSQNTNDRNAGRAFENLSNRFRINPETLVRVKTRDIEECLKVAGLYRSKARAIQLVSRLILEKYHGNLGQVLSMPLEEARSELLQLEGVGPKTADVVLLLSAQKPTVPVDTHVNRVSKRLGLVPQEADYETTRDTLQSLYDPKDYLSVHVLLILHGRKYCRARVSLCCECPLNELCPSRHLGAENASL